MSVDVLSLLNLYAGYSHAVDDGDAQALRCCFAVDAAFRVVDPGAENGAGDRRMAGQTSIVEGIIGASALRPGFRHQALNQHMLPDGDGSVVRATADFVVLDASAQVEATGRYEDVFVLERSRWVISERTVRYGWRRGWV
jgi:hypothetical protein